MSTIPDLAITKIDRDHYERKIAELTRKNSDLLAYKERTQAVLDTAELTVRTAPFVPVVGIACDGIAHHHCEAAIGLVGTRIAHAGCDAVAQAMLPVAVALGWEDVDGKHLCPSCAASHPSSAAWKKHHAP